MEYQTTVWGSDEDQVLDTFHDLPMDQIPIGESGWRNFEMDTIKVDLIDFDE